MKKSACITLFIGVIIGTTHSAWAGGFSLGGSNFVIQGEYLYVADIGLPFAAGDTFENCYTFHEDLTPDDGLESGAWDDPLFPDPASPAPGTWVQHAKGTTTPYTAFADDGEGLTLVQNGTVTPAFGKKNVRLKAYSLVSVTGLGVIAQVLSKGYQVEACPSDSP